ncbi:hypothetical protein J2Y56_001045 [Pseudomonas sp. BE134]|nr:hypothetical protein [Pseudomonas sp. BE134]
MSAPTIFQPITKLPPQDKPVFLGKAAPGGGRYRLPNRDRTCSGQDDRR